MRRFFYLLTFILAFGLTSCSTPSLPPVDGGFSSMFAGSHSALDPDNDGDTKGSNHFPLTRPATGNKVFIFDPRSNSWAAYDANGRRVNTGRASGGKFYCPDVKRPCRTVVGKFRVISKGGADCVSSKFPLETNGGAPMPYCMHFGTKGYAIHGSDHVPDHNASHGCIRITPAVAKWLSENFMTVGTTVIVRPY